MNNNELQNKEKTEALEKSLSEMCSLLAKNNDTKTIRDFFECLFTPAELKDFATRWLLVKEIDNGTTQREIARKFGMSLCKITRGSRELKKPDSAFRRFLELAKEL
jgi:TrpR family trp operon transcriptional repressor